MLETRRLYQRAMKRELTELVEEITGEKVAAFFVLEGSKMISRD